MEQTTRPQAAATRYDVNTTARKVEDDTIDLLALLTYLWRNVLWIALATLVGGAVMFIYTVFFVTPLYSSSIMIYVNNSTLSVAGMSVSIGSSDLSASRSLVDTYLVILNSRETLEQVIEEGNYPYTYGQLAGMISSEAVNSTEVFQVTVTSADPQEASDIANTIAEVLPLRIKGIVEGSSAVRVDGAIPIYTPVSPNVTRNIAMGALVGLVAAGAVFVVLFLMDTEIHSENYLLTTYPNIPLLTVVPDVNTEGHGYSSYNHYGYGYGYGQHRHTELAADKKA